MNPKNGSKRKVQPMVVVSAGSMNETQNMNSRLREKGIGVRANTHDISTARGKLMVVSVFWQNTVDQVSPALEVEPVSQPKGTVATARESKNIDLGD